MTSRTLKAKDAAKAATSPRHVPNQSRKGKAVNAPANITSATPLTVTTVAQLIEAHIGAETEHGRLFKLSDWGQAEEEAVFVALKAADDAMLAICAAVPVDAEETRLKNEYLLAHLEDHIADCPRMAARAVKALLSASAVPQ